MIPKLKCHQIHQHVIKILFALLAFAHLLNAQQTSIIYLRPSLSMFRGNEKKKTNFFSQITIFIFQHLSNLSKALTYRLLSCLPPLSDLPLWQTISTRRMMMFYYRLQIVCYKAWFCAKPPCAGKSFRFRKRKVNEAFMLHSNTLMWHICGIYSRIVSGVIYLDLSFIK